MDTLLEGMSQRRCSKWPDNLTLGCLIPRCQRFPHATRWPWSRAPVRSATAGFFGHGNASWSRKSRKFVENQMLCRCTPTPFLDQIPSHFDHFIEQKRLDIPLNRISIASWKGSTAWPRASRLARGVQEMMHVAVFFPWFSSGKL